MLRPTGRTASAPFCSATDGSGKTALADLRRRCVIRFVPDQACVSGMIKAMDGEYSRGPSYCLSRMEEERDCRLAIYNTAKVKLSSLHEKEERKKHSTGLADAEVNLAKAEEEVGVLEQKLAIDKGIVKTRKEEHSAAKRNYWAAMDSELNADIAIARDEVDRAKVAYVLADEAVADATEEHDDLADEYQVFQKGNTDVDHRADIVIPATTRISTGILGRLLVSGGGGGGSRSCVYNNAKLQMKSADCEEQQRIQRIIHNKYAKQVKVAEGKAKAAKKTLVQRKSDLWYAKAKLANLIKEEMCTKEANVLVDAEGGLVKTLEELDKAKTNVAKLAVDAVIDKLTPLVVVARDNVRLAERECGRANNNVAEAEEELAVADYVDFLAACSEM